MVRFKALLFLMETLINIFNIFQSLEAEFSNISLKRFPCNCCFAIAYVWKTGFLTVEMGFVERSKVLCLCTGFASSDEAHIVPSLSIGDKLSAIPQR